MTTLGVLIPASGQPVAGGLIFFPILDLAGLEPSEAVSFSVSAQAVGVGIFTPISWFLKDTSIFLLPALACAIPAGVAGLVLALHFPLSNVGILWCLTIFLAFVAAFTIHGLLHKREDHSEPLEARRISVLLSFLLLGFLGGI